MLDPGDGLGQPAASHVVGCLGERAERAGEGTRGESGESYDEGGHERSRGEVGGEGQLGVVAEPVGPIPYVATDRLLDGVQVIDEYRHRVPPGAGVDVQRGAVGGARRLLLVGSGASGVLGREGVLQGRALGCGGDLPETGLGGDACGAHLAEVEVRLAAEGALGEHAVEEPAFESDGLLDRGQLSQRRKAVAQLTVGARRGLRHRIDGVQGIDGARVEGENRVRVGGACVGGGTDVGQPSQVTLEDIVDRPFGAHRAQRRVNALAGSGE